jgi:ketosteroid isomerase-like protein
MASMAGPVEPGLDHAESPNVRVVRDTFEEALGEGGMEAAIEHLLSHSHDDVQFAPYIGAGLVLCGVHEVRAYYRGQVESGTVMTARLSSIDERGDEVVVNGSLRVLRPAGGFAESQISWTFRFRDGRLQEARGGPRRAA